ncbi:MAG: UDP-N-acetylglucosamine 2-epimerase (non-hydrolyzing) [Acidobacteriota bacterium]|nr:UDP-N-acetylglucosamine 2-epimerase (non-hydrolyzing) [Acidobacteriota bacterium]
MTGRLKVATIVGTRPELIKLSRVIAELDLRTDHVLVHTGQNYDYELNGVFFEELEIRKPDHFLEAAGETAAATVGQVIERADHVLSAETPNALLVLGDTNSCMAAYSAKRLKIPVFHMEAGNRSFDERVPEEINRRLIDHLSDINLPYTEHARRYLLSEGLDPARVIKTGSPMREVLSHHRDGIDGSDVLARLELERDGFLVASAHREENVDDPDRLRRLFEGLNALVETYDRPVVFSTHPRTRNRLDSLDGAEPDQRIRFLKALGFLDYIKLQREAFCVLSDSGSLTEEASILDFPAVTLRDAHERPEGMDQATLLMSGLESERILQAVALATDQHSRETRRLDLVDDYKATNVSRKVVRIILSYIDYVRSTVWRETT